MLESAGAAKDLLTGTLAKIWKDNRSKIDDLDKWYRGNPDKPTMPRRPSREFKELQQRSITPWLSLVVTSVAQSLYVEGYRSKTASENIEPLWAIWQANGLDARQIAVHRGALAHGLSYVTVLPGDPVPVIRGVSARKMVTVYQDPIDDEWPMYAVRAEPIHAGKWRWKIIDDARIWTFDGDAQGQAVEYVTFAEHNAGVVPVIRFANILDLDGRATGEIEPFIPLAGRIDQDTFDRLVVQRYAAWVVRYIAGMAEPEGTDLERRAASLKLGAADLLVSEDKDTKFGTLAATPLDGFIKSRDADIRDLAAVSQTPPHHLLGEVANLSAEALAAAEAGLTRKVEERKHSFGESWEAVLRLTAFEAGALEAADDVTAEVTWRDMESRSLAQVADALGKIATMLSVPPQALWDRIPGVTQTEVERWKQIAEETDVFSGLLSELERGATEPAA